MWHLPRHRREFTDQQKLLRMIFGFEDKKVKTICGIAEEPDQVMTRDQYLADKGENSGLWCPLCFGG